MNTLTRQQKAYHMKNKNTAPELVCQTLIKRLGINFSTHKQVGGCFPDIIIEDAKLVIFVHGCYWHNHGCTIYSAVMKDEFITNARIRKTINKDKQNLDAVRKEGYRALVIWECELKNLTEVESRLIRRLNLSARDIR